MAEEERQIGRYMVQEHTARRLVVETQGVTPVALGVLWAAFLVVAVLITPWRGGTRPFITVAVAGVVVAISLLVMRFVPRLERLTVDVETGECRVERIYLLPRIMRARGVQIPLAAARGVQCRPRIWRDKPGVEAVRWAVELVGEGGQTWRLDEGAEQEQMQELARLVAEVSGRPLSETD